MTAPGTLAERAYVDLREEIIGVRLPPGTLLREEELMQRLGVGRTPVREAVQRLQRDGFVTVIPRRGTLVSEISITDLAAIYEVRKKLESWASRLAAERITDAEREEARALLTELKSFEAGGDYEYRISRADVPAILRRRSNVWLILQGVTAQVTFGSLVWLPRLLQAKAEAQGYPQATAIVVGSEGHGLSPAVRRRCDLFVRIPMKGAIGSLNAAVAGSILLFEALGQRDPGARPAAN